jgi:pimeloyl-ACP methyl ester carboxylesterase
MRYLVLLAAAAAAFAAPGGEPTHEFFTTSDGVKIHYMRLGQAGSYVVLIHGYTGSAEGNWFKNGIAAALAANHRVVAIDNRNHGRSDKPQLNGPGKAEDTIELMDHLHIQKAHIHGYSMGGMITGTLLATHPDRFITASFGGSGIAETDPEWIAKLPPDKQGVDPQEAGLSRALRIHHAMDNGMSQEEAEKLAATPPAARTATAAPRPLQIDLTKVRCRCSPSTASSTGRITKRPAWLASFSISPTWCWPENRTLPRSWQGPCRRSTSRAWWGSSIRTTGSSEERNPAASGRADHDLSACG